MKAAAVVMTYGRAEVCELIAMLERQTLQLPTLLYVDGRPELRVRGQPDCLNVVHAPPLPTFGAVRRRSIEWARELLELDASSAVLVLDDDDFYSSRHFELTIDALTAAPGGWTGASAMGLTLDGGPVEYVRSVRGPGQHATWGFLLGLYDQAGGYDAALAREEDTTLGYAMKWSNCTPHGNCTHVRRQNRGSISGAANFDRQRLRASGFYAAEVRPSWSEELDALEQWCATRLR